MNYKTCLIELSVEEIPSQQIRKIANQFYLICKNELKKYNIIFSKINIFETPRRIALIIKKLDTSPIVIQIKCRGPATKNAFDTQGSLTESGLKWLNKFNITLKQTKKIKTDKGEWLFYQYNKKKISIQKILINMVNCMIQNTKIPKTMYWNNYNIKFIRPIRKIIILLNETLIPFHLYNLHSKKYLYGNIFNKFNKIKIEHAKEYENLLYRQGQVIAKFNIRKKKIQYTSQKLANTIYGKIQIHETLLDEITGLVEWPNILLGKFEKNFLEIPWEIIIHVMEKIHKFIPIYHMHKSKLTNHFIIVSNSNCKKNYNIILGNTRVLHARLFDIKFFLKKDNEIKLHKHFLLLKNIIFYEPLGTILDKSKRLIKLIQYIVKYTKSNLENSIRAAYLSKCDLNTHMVYEFPELKGIIGMYYALQNGESQEIALSIKEQYYPKFFEDQLPSTKLSCSLALTEKIDTIVGLFLINKIPTQDKDPFFLRRLTIGIIRIIIEKKIDINLYEIIKYAISTYSHLNIQSNKKDTIMSFIINRLSSWYQKKYNINIIKSVLTCHRKNLLKIDMILNIILQFKNNILLKDLIITYKRIKNLLKTTYTNYKKEDIINYQLFQNEEEKQLFLKINNTKCMLYILIKNKKYYQIFNLLTTLNKPINNFLNTNSIKYTTQCIQKNRIILLIKIKKIFLTFTDFSKL
ncbi:Glycine--tRNA ligase beta subunit [Buchnera aphidicola (Takecallis arundicolens)]|uniref:glycine--tRNA ligase subunit beta n=1 Tax=Buchnera aphidicola TaxID=9 RepID=UPI003463B27C